MPGKTASRAWRLVASGASRLVAPGWARLALISVVGAAGLFLCIVLAYQLALARVPQHRAVLERLVQSQTGLDVRFGELGLRWGWYGPEAVFRRVELSEPGQANVLLRAPQLTVGFDAWRSMRSGHLEAGLITLIAPDIDVEHFMSRAISREAQTGGARAGGSPEASAGAARSSTETAAHNARARLLQHWRDGRIDIQGGTLRLPGPTATSDALTIQIRRAAIRRAAAEWNFFALVYLPERLGRTARVALRLSGDLEKPEQLSGTLRLETRRMEFAGWRDFREIEPIGGRFFPVSGSGDLTVNLDFDHGQLTKADGDVHAGGVVLDPAVAGGGPLNIDRVRGKWRLARHGPDWRVRVEGLEMGPPADDSLPTLRPSVETAMTVEAAAGGEWVRGKLDAAPLQPVARIARWLAPFLTSADVEFGGTARGVEFDWSSRREQGPRLRTSAKIEDLSVSPRSHAFALTGKSARVSGSEDQLTVDLHNATLSGSDEDVGGIDARIEWLGGNIHAVASTGHAGPFRLASATADWDTRGEHPVRVSGRLRGNLQDAVEWLRTHPGLSHYAPRLQNFELSGETQLDIGMSVPALASENATTRVIASFADAQFRPVAGAAPIEGLTGSLAFEGGRLQRTTLTGQWLGGPVTMHVGERRERGRVTIAAQARGVVDANQLAVLAGIDAKGRLGGATDWTADLTYFPESEAGPAQWRVRADSGLLGIVSELPEPLAKNALVPAPLRVDLSGTDNSAELRVTLGERLRSLLTLQRMGNKGWRVERGAVNFGTALPQLPAGPELVIQGRVDHLDLPWYLAAWQQTRQSQLSPAIRAHVSAGEMVAAGQSYRDVTITGGRVDTANVLRREETAPGSRADSAIQVLLDSDTASGVITWPATASASEPVDVHFARLSIQNAGSAESDSAATSAAGIVAAIGANARVSIDQLTWQGHKLGRAKATFVAREGGIAFDDVSLSGETHEGHGTVRCAPGLGICRAAFALESSDVQSTLEDFGFRPDVSASKGSLTGNLEWEPEENEPWLASAVGRVSVRVADGLTREVANAESSAGVESGAGAETGGGAERSSFPLLAVPAFMKGMVPARARTAASAPTPASALTLASAPMTTGAPIPASAPMTASASTPADRELRFASLDADFDVRNGQASTSDLHFDGDAEILMRGRTGLVARDYDQQVWVLRGEERLPAPVRKFAPTPRVAAAWLALREMFAGTGQERPRAALRLQGSWDEPVVVENR